MKATRSLFACLLAWTAGLGGAGVRAAETVAPSNNTAHVTADVTYYDRREGLAVFRGNLHVYDATYDLHADNGLVELAGTNDVRRIVATGHVALTNGLKRAYGEKAVFRRDKGLVTLYGGDGISARVVDEAANGARTVRGRRIRVWLDSEQIEVVEAEIEAENVSGGKKDGGFGLGDLMKSAK